MLAGCATTAGQMIGDATVGALETLGMKKPEIPVEIPELQKPPRKIKLRLFAGENLNADTKGRPLAVVMKIYKLKNANLLASMPYDSFLSPAKEKEALGSDLLDVREVTLIPGKQYEFEEKVSREAGVMGIVTLFHSPSSERWRYVFGAADSEESGITVGIHACAMTVSAGKLAVGDPVAAANLSTTRCFN
jgi:type VI secretion system protein VasD